MVIELNETMQHLVLIFILVLIVVVWYFVGKYHEMFDMPPYNVIRRRK